jgi:hypothetical protein
MFFKFTCMYCNKVDMCTDNNDKLLKGCLIAAAGEVASKYNIRYKRFTIQLLFIFKLFFHFFFFFTIKSNPSGFLKAFSNTIICD